MTRIIRTDNLKIVGDPHLGKSFINGVPLARRGERERLVREAFVRSLGPEGAEVHICMGDLFDRPVVPLETIMFAATEYNAAALRNQGTHFYILAGNHDLDRDLTKVSAFLIFNRMLWNENVHTIMGTPQNRSGYLFIPWSPRHNAVEVIDKAWADGLFESAETAFGHWDLDGQSPNLIPIEQLKRLGVKRVYNGHVHLPRTETRDGIEIINVGSLQGYAHGEDPDLYVTVGLEEARTQDLKDKCVRVRLEPGEVVDFEIDCLQLQIQTPEQNVDLSVDYDASFNLRELIDRAGADVPAAIWDKVKEKL